MDIQAYNRMDGLVHTKAQEAMKKAMAQVIESLREEGYEDDEITAFIEVETHNVFEQK